MRVISLLFPTLALLDLILIPTPASSFIHQKASPPFMSSTVLKYINDTHAVASELKQPFVSSSDLATRERRNQLKEELAICSIENFDFDAQKEGATVAEDIMKRLEPLRPWRRPAEHPGLNARFSFVFTGVPTIGMQLITLLSRISVGFPIVDFKDVFLEVSNQNTKAKAIVNFKVFGVPFELNVRTNLCADKSCPKGTMMNEHFQGITLQGWTVPTPEAWHRSRTLEISYLDEDMMIARTAGGEPHFLLRHSSCSTDDLECDIDTDLTVYFEDAKAKYGEKIARCLVDREFGMENDCGTRTTNPLSTILPLEAGSLLGAKRKDS